MSKKTKLMNLLFAFRWMAFFSLFLSIFFLIEPLFTSKRRIEIPIIQDVYLSDIHNYDVYFIGSSHIYSAIDLPLINDNSPIKSALFHFENGGVRDALLILKRMVDGGKTPSVLVLDSFSLIDRQEKKGETQKILFFNGFDIENRLMVLNDAILFSEPKNLVNFLSPVFNFHSVWKNRRVLKGNYHAYTTYYLHKKDKTRTEKLFNNYTKDHYKNIQNQTASLFEFSSDFVIGKDPFDDYTIFQLLRLKNYCGANNIKLIIIDIPALNTSGVDLLSVEEFCQRYGIDFYRYDDLYREKYKDGHIQFLQGGHNSHLNPNGSKYFTAHYILPLLSEEFNFDYQNQTAEEISQLTQVELSIDKANNPKDNVTFKMIASNKNNNLQYYWKLIQKDKNKKIILEQKGVNNSFSIPKKYWDNQNYKLEVRVSSPKLPDEELRFSIPLS